MKLRACGLQLSSTLTRRMFVSALSGGAALGLASGRARADFTSLAPVAYVIDDEATYDRALSYASRLQGSALVYFGAKWCSICRTLERSTFQHAAVHALLQSIALVKVDVTAMDHDSKALLHRFKVTGPPTLFIVSTHSGKEHAGSRMVGKITVEELVERLRPFAA